MNDIDKTAQAILTSQADSVFVQQSKTPARPAMPLVQGSVCPISDIQVMARLWLLLPEIREQLKVVVETGDPYHVADEATLLAKLSDEALEIV